MFSKNHCRSQLISFKQKSKTNYLMKTCLVFRNYRASKRRYSKNNIKHFLLFAIVPNANMYLRNTIINRSLYGYHVQCTLIYLWESFSLFFKIYTRITTEHIIKYENHYYFSIAKTSKGVKKNNSTDD